MAVHHIKGNLLDTHCQYICHQVNCKGVMGSGVAKAIRDKWPIVYKNYRKKYEEAEDFWTNNPGINYISDLLLGTIQCVPLYEDYNTDVKHQCVINMFSQNWYGYDKARYTSYEAFWTCLEGIKAIVQKGSTIAFPDHIGCCRGGANWPVIHLMICEVLGEDFEVFIYKLEE